MNQEPIVLRSEVIPGVSGLKFFSILSQVQIESENKGQVLFEAIQNHNLELVRLLINDPQVDITATYGQDKLNLLMVAIQYNSNDALGALLKLEAIDIMQQTKSKLSPLILAVKMNNANAVEILLPYYSQCTSKSDEETRRFFQNAQKQLIVALLHSVSVENLKMAQMLTKYTNPNGTDSKGNTPLMIAIEKKNVNLIKILLAPAHAINFDAKNKEDKTVFDIAGQNNGIIKLIRKAKLQATNGLFTKAIEINLGSIFGSGPLNINVEVSNQ
jgi:ankyrin repeat protein